MTSLPPHSPAELLLLLAKYHKPSLRQLLRITFLDLLRQQVLAINNEPNQPHPRDPVTWQQYIVSGPALRTHAALPHENLLLNVFRVDDQLCVPFKQYVRLIFEKAQTAAAYYKLIQANTRTGQLFSQHWFWRLISTRYLTPEGQQMQAAVEAELARLNKELARRAESSAPDAFQFSQQLGGVVFLLPSFMSEVGRQLEQELRQIPEPTYDTGTNDSGGGDFTWHSHGDTFDSHSAGYGDSHSSGCGGDSSSSDSGCGGDSGGGGGGCGGD